LSLAASASARVGGWPRLLLWGVPLLWSSNYVIARLADGVIAPHALAAGRWLLAALILLPWLGAGLWGRRARLWRERRHLLVLGVLGMYVCGAWVYVAGRSTTSANIALIYAATPVTIAAASAWLLKERLRPAQWVGLALALAGVLFVITQGQLTRLLTVRFVPGDAWITACALAWTAYSVLLKRWSSALGAGERLLAIIGGGLLVLLPAAVVEAAFTPVPAPSWAALGLVLAAAVLPGVLSYSAHSYLQREIGASRTAMMLYLSPVYGALLAWWILGEQPGWHHLGGALLILPSIWLATRTAPVVAGGAMRG